MWIVELNILGRRYTREIGHRRARDLTQRSVHSRITRFLNPRTAA